MTKATVSRVQINEKSETLKKRIKEIHDERSKKINKLNKFNFPVF